MSESDLAEAPTTLDPIEQRRSHGRAMVLQAIATAPPEGIGVIEIMAAAGIRSREAADKCLSRLHEDGKVTRVRRGRYILAQAGTPREEPEPEPAVSTRLIDHGELRVMLIDAAGGNVVRGPGIDDVTSVAAMVDYDGCSPEDALFTVERELNPRFGGKRPALKSWSEMWLLNAIWAARELRVARELAFDRAVHGARVVSPGKRDQPVTPPGAPAEPVQRVNPPGGTGKLAQRAART